MNQIYCEGPDDRVALRGFLRHLGWSCSLADEDRRNLSCIQTGSSKLQLLTAGGRPNLFKVLALAIKNASPSTFPAKLVLCIDPNGDTNEYIIDFTKHKLEAAGLTVSISEDQPYPVFSIQRGEDAVRLRLAPWESQLEVPEGFPTSRSLERTIVSALAASPALQSEAAIVNAWVAADGALPTDHPRSWKMLARLWHAILCPKDSFLDQVCEQNELWAVQVRRQVSQTELWRCLEWLSND